VTDEQSRLFLK